MKEEEFKRQNELRVAGWLKNGYTINGCTAVYGSGRVQKSTPKFITPPLQHTQTRAPDKPLVSVFFFLACGKTFRLWVGEGWRPSHETFPFEQAVGAAATPLSTPGVTFHAVCRSMYQWHARSFNAGERRGVRGALLLPSFLAQTVSCISVD